MADNAGGHLMQRGDVDMVIVGTDRTTSTGDVANKIGTYLKALAAHDNGVPFYVALPHSTIDWTVADGADIPIEERSGEEVTHVTGRAADGRIVTPAHSASRVTMLGSRNRTGIRLNRGHGRPVGHWLFPTHSSKTQLIPLGSL